MDLADEAGAVIASRPGRARPASYRQGHVRVRDALRRPSVRRDDPRPRQGTWNLAEDRHPRRTRPRRYARTRPRPDPRRHRRGVRARRAGRGSSAKPSPGGATKSSSSRRCRPAVRPARRLRRVRASLHRLGTDRIDLYLLHWRGRCPADGDRRPVRRPPARPEQIRHWGVSNFDLGTWYDRSALPGGAEVPTNQVLYNLARRGVESTLLPGPARRGYRSSRTRRSNRGRIAATTPCSAASRLGHGVTPRRSRWRGSIAQPGVCAIAEAGTPGHVRDNARAAQVDVGEDDLLKLDAAFPPPSGPIALEVV